MKKVVIALVLGLIFFAASCTQKTCPTYSKAEVADEVNV